MSSTIYILELEQTKYYVGRSKRLKTRILNHFSDNGSEWTKLYKPIRVISQIKGDGFDEEKHTLLTMDKYGIDNVRGGSYCQVKLSNNDKDKALQTIRSMTDRCYKCGLTGHFSKNCQNNKPNKQSINKAKPISLPAIKCTVCNNSGRSYWSDGMYGPCLECRCINCGKSTCICETYYCSDCNSNYLHLFSFQTPVWRFNNSCKINSCTYRFLLRL
jgi:hypothetical protein